MQLEPIERLHRSRGSGGSNACPKDLEEVDQFHFFARHAPWTTRRCDDEHQTASKPCAPAGNSTCARLEQEANQAWWQQFGMLPEPALRLCRKLLGIGTEPKAQPSRTVSSTNKRPRREGRR